MECTVPNKDVVVTVRLTQPQADDVDALVRELEQQQEGYIYAKRPRITRSTILRMGLETVLAQAKS